MIFLPLRKYWKTGLRCPIIPKNFYKTNSHTRSYTQKTWISSSLDQGLEVLLFFYCFFLPMHFLATSFFFQPLRRWEGNNPSFYLKNSDSHNRFDIEIFFSIFPVVRTHTDPGCWNRKFQVLSKKLSTTHSLSSEDLPKFFSFSCGKTWEKFNTWHPAKLHRPKKPISLSDLRQIKSYKLYFAVYMHAENNKASTHVAYIVWPCLAKTEDKFWLARWKNRIHCAFFRLVAHVHRSFREHNLSKSESKIEAIFLE